MHVKIQNLETYLPQGKELKALGERPMERPTSGLRIPKVAQLKQLLYGPILISDILPIREDGEVSSLVMAQEEYAPSREVI